MPSDRRTAQTRVRVIPRSRAISAAGTVPGRAMTSGGQWNSKHVSQGLDAVLPAELGDGVPLEPGRLPDDARGQPQQLDQCGLRTTGLLAKQAAMPRARRLILTRSVEIP